MEDKPVLQDTAVEEDEDMNRRTRTMEVYYEYRGI